MASCSAEWKYVHRLLPGWDDALEAMVKARLRSLNVGDAVVAGGRLLTVTSFRSRRQI